MALEDSHNGVRSAYSAGMMTVMVPDLLEPTDEIRALCTSVARDLHEVRSLILASVRWMSGSNGWFGRRRKYRLDIHRDAGYARLREMLASKARLVGKGMWWSVWCGRVLLLAVSYWSSRAPLQKVVLKAQHWAALSGIWGTIPFSEFLVAVLVDCTCTTSTRNGIESIQTATSINSPTIITAGSPPAGMNVWGPQATQVPILAQPNRQATVHQVRNTIAPETVDMLVVVDRRTDEHLPVTTEPVYRHQRATGEISLKHG
jgi:hypothetical protein